MLTICWYCDSPIDVDEAVEGHTEIHADCLLELSSGGSWATFLERADRQREHHTQAITRIDQVVAGRRAALLA